MKSSFVNQAVEAYLRREYKEAIALYEKAGDILGVHLFFANIEICKKRIADESIVESNYLKYTNKKPSEYKVALVSDEFTFNSFKNEFIALPVEPSNWKDVFLKENPDIFLCESAWSGIDPIKRPWKGQVYASKNFKNENRSTLLEILAYCKKQGIPTVFWNKEDPTHYTDRIHDFVKTATEFDFIFTSAEECVDMYKNEYGVEKVFVLPFAANPILFNPIETENRTNEIVFAGSWYCNHLQRSKDMEFILDALTSKGKKLKIYDRYYGDSDPNHFWPERYKQYINPSQPHSRMPSVYKSSKYGLNINTVVNSKSMFARRVFELMSSNTLVISNYSAGIQEMFGDLVIFADKTPHRLNQLSEEEESEIRERALHCVLRDHTYSKRWKQILDAIKMPYVADDPTVTIVCEIANNKEAADSVGWFHQYGHKVKNSKLLLLINKSVDPIVAADLYKNFNKFGVMVTSRQHAEKYAISGSYQPISTNYFAVVNFKLQQNEGWISKAVLHAQYMKSHFIQAAENKSGKYKINRFNSSADGFGVSNLFIPWLMREEKLKEAYFI